jgi:hypothetical protein
MQYLDGCVKPSIEAIPFWPKSMEDLVAIPLLCCHHFVPFIIRMIGLAAAIRIIVQAKGKNGGTNPFQGTLVGWICLKEIYEILFPPSLPSSSPPLAIDHLFPELAGPIPFACSGAGNWDCRLGTSIPGHSPYFYQLGRNLMCRQGLAMPFGEKNECQRITEHQNMFLLPLFPIYFSDIPFSIAIFHLSLLPLPLSPIMENILTFPRLPIEVQNSLWKKENT